MEKPLPTTASWLDVQEQVVFVTWTLKFKHPDRHRPLQVRLQVRLQAHHPVLLLQTLLLEAPQRLQVPRQALLHPTCLAQVQANRLVVLHRPSPVLRQVTHPQVDQLHHLVARPVLLRRLLRVHNHLNHRRRLLRRRLLVLQVIRQREDQHQLPVAVQVLLHQPSLVQDRQNHLHRLHR